MGYQTILFDVDGTLLDTFDFIYGAFEHALRANGFELPIEGRTRFSSVMGGPLEECYRVLAPGCDASILADAHRAFQSENLQLAKLFDGTRQTLEILRQRNMQLAAVTTRSARTSVRSLESTGIAHFFDLVLSFEDVENVKPHPEPILKALKRFGTNPANAVMVGDTYADIESGKRAGVYTVAALYGFGGDALIGLRPDSAIRSISELPDIL